MGRNYTLILSKEAELQLVQIKMAGNKPAMKKIKALFQELEEHPHTGTGNIEQLKHELSGLWSRRIDRKNRLVYGIDEDERRVCIISVIGHYRDR